MPKSIIQLFIILFFILSINSFKPVAFAKTVKLESSIIKEILSKYDSNIKYKKFKILYPINKTIFPPDIVAPKFKWEKNVKEVNAWVITIKFLDNSSMNFVTLKSEWTPDKLQWDKIKKQSIEKKAVVTIIGINNKQIITQSTISIKTSKHEVGAPLFYREVNLPFIDAVKDPSNISWRFGSISSPEKPPVVLDNLPVCGNCHSFSSDGKTLGMDVDYANDKGSYAFTKVKKNIILSKDQIITWSDYKRDDKELTFGLLSQVSPDGRYAVSTVKDRSVFVPRDDLFFSQLFFPIKGILAVYSKETKTFKALKGADDPDYVQSDPTWSPDGKYIVFARSKRYDLKTINKNKGVLLTKEECREFLNNEKQFLYDLYRVPFNNGNGGKIEPLKGASNNGKSNFFAKYSPDGKWIVFCQAKSFMLLQKDSELFIIPAQGGKARKLSCNTSRMNSWHSWSPNSKWLVFTSKINTAYTQLFLTHIDEQGHSSPPVVLSHFTSPDRAANIPEFVNNTPDSIKNIKEKFIDDVSFFRAGTELLKAGDIDDAIIKYNKSLEINPKNIKARLLIAKLLIKKNKLRKAKSHLSEILRLDPDNAEAYYNIGNILMNQGDFTKATENFNKALQIEPNFNSAHNSLGIVCENKGEIDKAINHYLKSINIDQNDVYAHYNIGNLFINKKAYDKAILHLSKALDIKPDLDIAHNKIGIVLSNKGDLKTAIEHFSKAIKINPKFAEAHNNLGIALAGQNKIQKAADEFLKALNINPDYAEAHNNLGIALMRIGIFNKAVEHFKEALEITPEYLDAQQNLNQALKMIKKSE